MEVDTIVNLKDNRKYYLVDETIQDNKKYFLSLKLNAENNPTNESEIFEEFKENDGIYLTPVIDDDKLNSLAAIFLAKYRKLLEED